MHRIDLSLAADGERHHGAVAGRRGLLVEGRDYRQSMHAKALSLGATDEGAPGARGETFYGGYFRDLDGNKLNFFFMG